MCGGNTWGTVCSDRDWGVPEANVVCGQLGFINNLSLEIGEITLLV